LPIFGHDNLCPIDKKIGLNMNVKMILLSSAAALAAISGAHAADAIVAAEPEAVEYVRVCDAYGTGYFYIPGTETCLSIGGYIRTEARYGRIRNGGYSYNLWTRGQVTFSAKSDTEYGPLTGVMTLRSNAENSSSSATFLQEAYIDIAGLRAGLQYDWWDNDLSGETDTVASNSTVHNSIRYMYQTPNFSAGVAVDELEEAYTTKLGETPNNLGVEGQLFGKAGAISGYLLAGYDTDTSEVAIRAIGYADIGPGQLGVYGVWASGVNYYYEESEWTVGAQYAVKLTDKLTVTPGVQYFHNLLNKTNRDFSGDNDSWKAGVTIDYKIATNLTTKLSVQYTDPDNAEDQIGGFLRLQRSF
jgi:hypothetical protein